MCEVRKIGKDIMMNKPTVLSTGEWLFPMAVWRKGLCPGGVDYSKEDNDRKAFAYKTVDCGRTFIKLGGIEIKTDCMTSIALLNYLTAGC